MKRIAAMFIFMFLFVSFRSTPLLGVNISSVTVTEDSSILENFTRYTVTGIRTPLPQLPDVPGFIGASYLEMGDIDGDDVEEIICTSGVGLGGDALTAGDGAVAIFKSTGANAHNWTQAVISSTFSFPNETHLRDMDGDGDLDIMVMDNFLAGWFTCGVAGIYYLENQGGDITSPANWVKQIIHQGEINGTCPCSPFGQGTCTDGVDSYHRVIFVDLDGDDREDFITTRVHMWKWQWTTEQYVWTEWFKKDGDADPTAYLGPYVIGDGAGFLFNTKDIDGDLDLDVIGPQFFIQAPGGLVVKGSPDGSDPRGDSLIWFENPGTAVLSADPNTPWNRYAIDNWYTSVNPMGKGMEVVTADIDDDGVDELVFSNHNHQEYKPADPPNNRIWPAGVYLLEIPADPEVTSNWAPIAIETGDPDLVYDKNLIGTPNLDPAVLADVYAVDRPGGPYSQGSPGMVRAGDVNNDSNLDLLVPGDGKGRIYYYEGQGVVGTTLSYKRATLYNDPACMPGESDVADLDGDGHKDIVAVIFDTSVSKTMPAKAGSIFLFSNDNCPTVANTGQEDVGDGDGVGDACDNCSTLANPGQEDSYPPAGNNCGNACECEGDFNSDGKVDGTDVANFKKDFGRSSLSDPCSNTKPCKGDFTCNKDVSGTDAALFKSDFGRNSLNRPCPSCPTATWCSY